MIRSGLVAYHDSLRPLLVPIDSVHPHPENHNNGDVEVIAASIEKYGMYRPIQVQTSTGHTPIGNHTWEACKSLGAEVIPVVWVDWDDDTARSAMVDDNEIARLAVVNPAAELALLEQLAHTTAGLPLTRTEQHVDQLRALAESALDASQIMSWPTVCFKVPPHMRAAFYRITSEAHDETDRFEVLLRLAGWDGH